jgi:hypothetical protein
VQLRVRITQHSKDKLLMNNIKNTFNCGFVYNHYKDAVVLIVSKFEDINDKIIPLFHCHKIEGVKRKDYKDFCEVAKLINNKSHLRLEGLELIRKIKLSMNSNIIHV